MTDRFTPSLAYSVVQGDFSWRGEGVGGKMKTIGLIGGMSWESSAVYYRQINELVKKRCGGLHSAKVILYSLDFAEIASMQERADWQAAAQILVAAARSLQAAGADFLLLCTNTMHKVAAEIEAAIQIPLLHIADPTTLAIQAVGLHSVGLLGTRFTMDEEFYRARVEQQGLRVVLPPAAARTEVSRIIYEELCLGVLTTRSRSYYRDVISVLIADGAQGIILGCTEIGLLVTAADARVPLFDTTSLHALRAVELALESK